MWVALGSLKSAVTLICVRISHVKALSSSGGLLRKIRSTFQLTYGKSHVLLKFYFSNPPPLLERLHMRYAHADQGNGSSAGFLVRTGRVCRLAGAVYHFALFTRYLVCRAGWHLFIPYIIAP